MNKISDRIILLLIILSTVGFAGCQSSSQQNTDAPATPTTSNNMPPVLTGENTPSSASAELGVTPEEVIGELDAELDASIAVFDGMILSERAKAEAVKATFDDGSDTGIDQSGESLFEEGDLSEGLPGYGEFPGTAETDQDTDETHAGTTNQPAANTTTSAPAGSSTGTVPEDIGSGGDDDIVARQIREAATNEKDPVLREKLWDEYRKYKNQRRTN